MVFWVILRLFCYDTELINSLPRTTGAETNHTISVAVLPFYLAEDAEDKQESITVDYVVVENGATEYQRSMFADKDKRKLYTRKVELILQGNLYLSAKEN